MRKFAALAPLVFAASFALDAQEYVTGGVDLAYSGTLLASYGWSEIPDPIRGRLLKGNHYIYDQQTYAMLALNPYSVECVQNSVGTTSCKYVRNLTGGGTVGRCYRASLSGASVDQYGVQHAYNAFTSALICIPVSGSSGDGCSGSGGPLPTSIDAPETPRAPRDRPTRIDPTAPPPDTALPDAPDRELPRVQGVKLCGSSPILIDLEHEGFPLSDDAVSFDLDADGTPEKTNWTAAGSSVAFLALDRNGNGAIDDGAELFGNNTRLSTGEKAPYGYLALGEYDLSAFGGNFDGFIGPADAVWPKLRLWVDRNHDGVSQPDELLTLDQAGILKIESDYQISKKKDRYGNQFVARGRAWRENRHGDPKEMTLWDVWFVRR